MPFLASHLTPLPLSVAETALEFEHRDLHWGNILVKECPAEEVLTFCLSAQDSLSVESQGVVATIIDCSLSRLKLPQAKGKIVFNDLSQDPDLFNSVGDYQFDIYR